MFLFWTPSICVRAHSSYAPKCFYFGHPSASVQTHPSYASKCFYSRQTPSACVRTHSSYAPKNFLLCTPSACLWTNTLFYAPKYFYFGNPLLVYEHTLLTPLNVSILDTLCLCTNTLTLLTPLNVSILDTLCLCTNTLSLRPFSTPSTCVRTHSSCASKCFYFSHPLLV